MVERLRQIEAPPRQPTKAEVIKNFKECEKAHTCIPNWSYINAWDDAQVKKAHLQGYLKECAGKPICMPNSDIPKSK